jgi:hypothetical protein
MLQDLARRHELPLVDQLQVFRDKPQERVISDDDHCTIEGYDLMAAGVARILKADQTVRSSGAGI